MIPNRVVLDTNVCLDLFVFRDPRWAALHAALSEGKVVAVTRHDCRMEWTLVLDYTQFGLEAERRSACIAEFDSLVRCLPPAHAHDGHAFPTAISAGDDRNADDAAVTRNSVSSHGCEPLAQCAMAPLPRCSDGDDQKFLETARDSGAAVLITKDKALLKLAAKCRRAGLFDIQKPETWTSALSPSAAPANG